MEALLALTLSSMKGVAHNALLWGSFNCLGKRVGDALCFRRFDGFVPDLGHAGSRENRRKAALNSILMMDQTAINAGFDFRR